MSNKDNEVCAADLADAPSVLDHDKALWNKALAYSARRAAEGDGEELLRVVYLSALHQLPIPDDVRGLLVQTIRDYLTLEVRSLDEAFGVERPKGFRLADRRRRLDLEVPVYNFVIERVELGEPVDDALHDAAKHFGTSRTIASEMYYHVKMMLAY
jgi:hypothetical protein